MLLITFLIIFSAIALRNVRHGAYLIIFSMPLYLWRFSVFGIPTTALEIMIYILFLVWVINKLNFTHASESGQTLIRLRLVKNVTTGFKKNAVLNTGIILLFLGVIISTSVSSDIRTSLGIFKGWFFDPFLFFIILVSEIKTLKQQENILKALFFSGLAIAVASLACLFFPELNGVSYDRRLHGFYLSPNHLAMYSSPALIIGVWLIHRSFGVDFLKEKITGGKFFLSAISLIIIAAALYFTYSYAAWVAVFVAAILFFYLSTKKKPDFQRKFGVQDNKKFSLQKKTFLFAAIVLSFIALFLTQSGTGKFDNLKNLSYRSSYNSRLMIWRSAWEIGKDNWLIGIGPGNFQKYYLNYQAKFSEPYLEWAVPQPHNIFLAFWLETGILGFFGFLMILAWFFKRSLSLLKSNLSDRENFLLVAVLLSIMAYTIMHGLFDTTYWKNDLAMIFWVLLGLMAEIKNRRINQVA